MSDTASASPRDRLSVPVLAPRGRDAELVVRALAGTDLEVAPVSTHQALAKALGRPDTGLGVLTADAFSEAGLAVLEDALEAEPDWSEIPLVAFVDEGWTTRHYLALMDRLGSARRVTVLERPVRPVAFRAVVDLAVRGRRQQLRVRDLLERVNGFNAELSDRVREQTATLREQNAEVEALAASLANAERVERERIAQLLHDEVQQILFGVKIHLSVLGRDKSVDTDLTDQLEAYVDEAITETRLLTTELHAPTMAGDALAPSIEWVADFARRRHGLRVHLDVTESVTLPSEEVVGLLVRATRELLFNVIKHSGTAEAWVHTSCDAEGCRLVVTDRGRGGITLGGGTGGGLTGLSERVGLAGGILEVEDLDGGGSQVTVFFATPYRT